MRTFVISAWLLLIAITCSSQENMKMDAFNKKVNNPAKIVLVYFHADWCVPCIKLKPTMEQITSEEKESVEVLSLDADKNPEIAKYFEINTLPLFQIYKNGKKVWDNNTYMSKGDLKQKLDIYKEKK